jgi:hypothetical protein
MDKFKDGLKIRNENISIMIDEINKGIILKVEGESQ